MTDLEPVPDDVDLGRGEADLAVAAAQLRTAPSPRTVEIADRVLTRALAARRPSRMVRAHDPASRLRVSSLAITATLRAHLDPRLVGAAVRRVVLDVGDDDRLVALTVELYVQYGRSVLDLADLARTLTGEALVGLLGTPVTGPAVDVLVSNVHVADVTVGDPHRVDPHDE